MFHVSEINYWYKMKNIIQVKWLLYTATKGSVITGGPTNLTMDNSADVATIITSFHL